MVFFDGEPNVHKAGQILSMSYPQIILSHGSEHVLYLFTSNISKFPVIRARQRYLYKYTLLPYKYIFLYNTSNLEHLVTVGDKTEVQAHVPCIWGFL